MKEKRKINEVQFMDTQNNEYYATADMPQKSPLTEEKKTSTRFFERA